MSTPSNPKQPGSKAATLFSTLALKTPLLKNLSSLGYQQMTPIQTETLPAMLNKADIIGQAKTGSGKTAAFGLAILNHLQIKNYAVQALVLCPTRELATQVTDAIRQLARLLANVKVLSLCGGVAIRPQLESLKHHAHIIVGTPGRVQKHLDMGTLSLKQCHTLVLDEADRMLDMGFYDAIKKIISFSPPKRQTLLFSATYPPEIKQLAKKFMQQPTQVKIECADSHTDITQQFYKAAKQHEKFSLLKSLLLHHRPESTLIFCNTKEKTKDVTAQLKKEGFNAAALHGDMEQSSRDMAMLRFANRSCSILVATDVASRGLDIKDLPAVINYDLAYEHDVHVHRIGRTGRAGSEGIAINFITPSDANRLSLIEKGLTHPVQFSDINNLKITNSKALKPVMKTLSLAAGRKDKIRPGDILGALIKDAGLTSENIGKIDVRPLYSYVAIDKKHIEKAYKAFKSGKIKARSVKARIV